MKLNIELNLEVFNKHQQCKFCLSLLINPIQCIECHQKQCYHCFKECSNCNCTEFDFCDKDQISILENSRVKCPECEGVFYYHNIFNHINSHSEKYKLLLDQKTFSEQIQQSFTKFQKNNNDLKRKRSEEIKNKLIIKANLENFVYQKYFIINYQLIEFRGQIQIGMGQDSNNKKCQSDHYRLNTKTIEKIEFNSNINERFKFSQSLGGNIIQLHGSNHLHVNIDNLDDNLQTLDFVNMQINIHSEIKGLRNHKFVQINHQLQICGTLYMKNKYLNFINQDLDSKEIKLLNFPFPKYFVKNYHMDMNLVGINNNSIIIYNIMNPNCMNSPQTLRMQIQNIKFDFSTGIKLNYEDSQINQGDSLLNLPTENGCLIFGSGKKFEVILDNNEDQKVNLYRNSQYFFKQGSIVKFNDQIIYFTNHDNAGVRCIDELK